MRIDGIHKLRLDEPTALPEPFLNAILDTISQSVVVTNPHLPDNPIVYVNSAFQELTGYTFEEVKGRNCRFLQGLDTDPEAIRKLREAIRDCRPIALEILNYRKDGSQFWSHLRITPICDAEGVTRYFLGNISDVTARHRADHLSRVRVARRQSQLKTLLEMTTQALKTPDEVAVARQVTEAMAYAMDVERVSVWRHNTEHTALTCIDLFHKSKREHSSGMEFTAGTYPAYFQALEDHDVLSVADSRNDPRTSEFTDDYLVPLGIQSMLDVPLRPGGKLLGVLCCEHVGMQRTWGADEQVFAMAVANLLALAAERTDRRRAETMLSSILDNIFDSIIVIDEQGQIRTFNQGAERMFGYSAGEVIGRNIGVLMPDPHRMDHDAYIQRYLETGHKKVIGIGRQIMALRKDGTTFPADLAVSEFFMDNTRYFTGALHDLTDQRSLEEQFRQAQKMEAVGRLAGGVAHDFNNLLTIINGYGQILLETLPSQDPSVELLQEITRAGERAAGLTRQLLAFSRKSVLEPRVIDMNSLIQDMEKMLRRLIGEDIELVTHLAPGLDQVLVDPGQLEQVIVNLAINARDAMPQGGKLTIETQNMLLDPNHPAVASDATPGPYVLLSVSDNGHGMPPEVKAKIFEPFYTTKGPGAGTGLGLAMVYGFLQQSGGAINVYTEIDIGTTFKLYLPRAVQESTTGKSHYGTRISWPGTETILLVEDELGVRTLAAHVLRNAGYTVLEASNGKEAITLANNHPGTIHLILTDVVMPGGIGGRQLVEELHASRSEMKALFVSGYTDDAIVRHGVLAASVAFLQKPFSPMGLAAKVRAVLDDEL